MSEDFKYLHFNNDQANAKLSKKQARANQSRTFAVKALTEQQFKENISVFTGLDPAHEAPYMRLNVGVARTSIDDNYSRKTGRDISASKAKYVDLQIQSAAVTQEHILINFAEYEGVKLTARLNRITGFSTFFGKLA